MIRGGYNAGMYKFGRNKEVVRFLIRNPRDGLESQLIIRQMLDTIFCTDISINLHNHIFAVLFQSLYEQILFICTI